MRADDEIGYQTLRFAHLLFAFANCVSLVALRCQVPDFFVHIPVNDNGSSLKEEINE